MCLLRVNDITLAALAELTHIGENKKQICEKRLVMLAEEANATNAGHFDDHSGSLKGFPSDLRHIRHYRFGKASRHRIYLSGSHKQCYYSAWYVKCHKKSDVDAENDKAFQNKLSKALNDVPKYIIALDSETETYVRRDIPSSNPPEDLPEVGPANQSPAGSR